MEQQLWEEKKEVGSIEEGKLADLVILDKDRYKFLSYTIGVNIVEKVIKRGELVYDKKQAYID